MGGTVASHGEFRGGCVYVAIVVAHIRVAANTGSGISAIGTNVDGITGTIFVWAVDKVVIRIEQMMVVRFMIFVIFVLGSPWLIGVNAMMVVHRLAIKVIAVIVVIIVGSTITTIIIIIMVLLIVE